MFGLTTKKKAEAEITEAMDTLHAYYKGVLAQKEAELHKVLTANGELKRANDDFARGVHDAAEQYGELKAECDRLQKALAEKSAASTKPVHDCTKCAVKVSGNYRSCASCAANPKLKDKYEAVE